MPVTMPVVVSETSPMAWAMPKSVILRRAVGGDEHVGGLDVTVHDPRAVGRGQGRGHLGADPRDLGHRHPAVLGEQLGQAAGGEVLHDQAGLAVVLDDVEDRDGVRVVQARGDPGLAHRPVRPDLGVRRVQPGSGVQALDRHVAAQALVEGPPDHAHAAGADLLDQPVAADEDGFALAHAVGSSG